jgi:hypothetical protein
MLCNGWFKCREEETEMWLVSMLLMKREKEMADFGSSSTSH